MKYTIEGFSQQEAIRVGLDAKDLILLRWILDFYNTGCMEMHLFQDKQYFWVDYGYIVRELPILGINSKDVLARRMRHIEETGLLKFMCFEGAGNKTYFSFNEKALFSMLSDTNKQQELFDLNRGGSYPKVGRVPTQKSEGFLPKSRKQLDSSINDSSIKDSKQQPSAVHSFKPVENSKTEHSEAFRAKAETALKKGFNIYQLTNRFYKQSKLTEALPEAVLGAVIERFLLNGSNVKDHWAYYITTLTAEAKKHFADRNESQGKAFKKEPAAIVNILAGMISKQ